MAFPFMALSKTQYNKIVKFSLKNCDKIKVTCLLKNIMSAPEPWPATSERKSL